MEEKQTMDRTIKSFSVGEIEVKRNSWHYRLYGYWLRMGGMNKFGYKENLCHYCRVVGLWAPKRWFFQERFWKVFRPWMVAALMLLIAAAYIWPIYAFLLVFIIVFCAAWILIPKGASNLWRKLREEVSIVGRLDIWWSWNKDNIETIFAASLGVAVLLALIAFLVFLICFHLPVIIGILAGIVLILMVRGFKVLFIKGCRKLKLFNMKRDTANASVVPEFVKTASGGVVEGAKLVIQYIIAQKRRICPFIKFVGP